MKKLVFLALCLPFMVQAAPKFVEELGHYDYSQSKIENYYQEYGIDYFSIAQASNKDQYKKNLRNQFQIQNWFSHDWFNLQQRFKFDQKKYLNYYQANSLNEAKQTYYGKLNFKLASRYHEEEVSFFREWGGLNHPPVIQKISNLTKVAPHYTPIDYAEVTSPLLTEEFHTELDKITNTELSFGNKLQVLEDRDAFLKKLELIKGAKNHILMSSLVFVCDSSTYELTQELIKKAKSGVKVYVLLDRFVSGALWHYSCPAMMKDGGVNLIKANDFFKYNGRAIYHSKKLVVDYKQAIVGGHNMLNADNLSRGTDFKNRDIDLLIEGPMVSDIAAGFIRDYNHFFKKGLKPRQRRANQIYGKKEIQIRAAKRSLENFIKLNIAPIVDELNELKRVERSKNLRGQKNYSQILENKSDRNKGVCRFVQQSPYDDGDNIGRAYLHYLDNTQSYLGIMNPEMLDTKYLSFGDKKLFEKFDTFTMYNKLHDKLMELGDSSSFKIDLITSGPEVAGNEVVAILHEKIRYNLEAGWVRSANAKIKMVNFWNNHFGKPHYENMIKDYKPRKNIDIWTHMSFIHSKIFYFDRLVSSIGSYNFHHNATDHAYENTIFCQDEKLNKELDEVFVRDMANSVPLVYRNLIN